MRWGGVPMDCRICRGPEGKEWRPRWGCDGPTEEPTLLLDSCWVCDGNDPECGTCEGSGRARLYECPNRSVNAAATDVCFHANLITAMSPLLPAAGGTLDQAAVFWDAVFFVLAQARLYDKKDEG